MQLNRGKRISSIMFSDVGWLEAVIK